VVLDLVQLATPSLARSSTSNSLVLFSIFPSFLLCYVPHMRVDVFILLSFLCSQCHTHFSLWHQGCKVCFPFATCTVVLHRLIIVCLFFLLFVIFGSCDVEPTQHIFSCLIHIPFLLQVFTQWPMPGSLLSFAICICLHNYCFVSPQPTAASFLIMFLP